MGLQFVNESGHDEAFLMPETICGGGALFDMDNDGDLDLYLVQSGSLYRDAPPNNPNPHSQPPSRSTAFCPT